MFPYHYGSHATKGEFELFIYQAKVSIPLWFSRNKRILLIGGLLVAVCQEGEEGNFKPCLIEDEGGPLEAAMQVEASNRRKLLW